MFLNITNHPVSEWPQKQIDFVHEKYGEIVEIPYPQINPTWTNEDIRRAVTELADQIDEMHPSAILVMGEFSLIFQMIDCLLQRGHKVLTACSVRNTVVKSNPDGTRTKIAKYDFQCFREYEYFYPRT